VRLATIRVDAATRATIEGIGQTVNRVVQQAAL
jgi:hypothetical protein